MFPKLNARRGGGLGGGKKAGARRRLGRGACVQSEEHFAKWLLWVSSYTSYTLGTCLGRCRLQGDRTSLDGRELRFGEQIASPDGYRLDRGAAERVLSYGRPYVNVLDST